MSCTHTQNQKMRHIQAQRHVTSSKMRQNLIRCSLKLKKERLANTKKKKEKTEDTRSLLKKARNSWVLLHQCNSNPHWLVAFMNSGDDHLREKLSPQDDDCNCTVLITTLWFFWYLNLNFFNCDSFVIAALLSHGFN